MPADSVRAFKWPVCGTGEGGAVGFVRAIATVVYSIAYLACVFAPSVGAFKWPVCGTGEGGAVGFVGAVATIVISIAHVTKTNAFSVCALEFVFRALSICINQKLCFQINFRKLFKLITRLIIMSKNIHRRVGLVFTQILANKIILQFKKKKPFTLA